MTILYVPNRFKYEIGLATNNFSTHTFKLALMADGFAFNIDSHGQLSNVSANIISAAGGYAAATLSVSSAWVQNNTTDKGSVSWDNVTFTAVGAAFDDFSAAIVFNDTHADDIIVGCIDFEMTISLAIGNSFQMQSLGFDAS